MIANGQILDGKYEVIKTLGEGGMAIVYLCRNTRLNNLWAIKEIKTGWKDSIDFLAEPNLLKDLNHPGIPRIIDIFNENNTLYMVEDYVEGVTLKRYVEQRKNLKPENVFDFSLQLCSIMDYLHSFNPPIIYRDLKPSNIMITKDNKVVLVDLGIARTYKPNKNSDTQVLGSVGFMAPEQLMNLQSNEQTDIYSLGSTMFFMCTGRVPSSTEEISDLNSYDLKLFGSIVPIIQKAAAVSQLDRYRSIKEVTDSLKKINDDNMDKTILAGVKSNTVELDKTRVIHQKKAAKIPNRSRRNKYIILTLLAFLLVGIFFISQYMGSKNKKENQNLIPPNASQPETKNETPPIKEALEKDIVVRGILYKNSPIIPNSSPSKGKGKKDEKPLHFIFALNPYASLSNSKMNITVKAIEISEGKVIASLDIENKSAGLLKVDLTKTFLVNGANGSFICDNQETGSFITIPANSKSQDLKISFKDFNFQGSNLSFKTSVLTNVAKDINLFIDIK